MVYERWTDSLRECRKMNPVSVVIPLYNKAPYIRRALESVLFQTVQPEEIIVVDDGSTDGGGDLVKGLNNPQINLIQQANQGVSAARNRGINEAKGDLIAFLDADDAWKPGYLETINRLRQRYPEAGIYATAFETISSKGVQQFPIIELLPPGKNDGLFDFLTVSLKIFQQCSWWWIHTSTTTVPKTIMEEIDGFPIQESLAEDFYIWLKIGLLYPIAWSREPLSKYFLDADNRISSQPNWGEERAAAKFAKEAIAANSIDPARIQDLYDFATFFYLTSARDSLAHGKRDLALKFLEYSKNTKRFARQWWKFRITAALPPLAGPLLLKMKKMVNNYFI